MTMQQGSSLGSIKVLVMPMLGEVQSPHLELQLGYGTVRPSSLQVEELENGIIGSKGVQRSCFATRSDSLNRAQGSSPMLSLNFSERLQPSDLGSSKTKTFNNEQWLL
ncbi:hypothetical protein VNO78_27014 [Psophocarpus tetragonolobus]|uniref:Uncharacterized protein n=1 Tax=Psophocarpus tetragonolobus TaxID=3891 RepID=A0AAN9S2Q1_PSOTE